MTADVPADARAGAVRDAATVVLLRDAPDGLQAWLLTRVRQMTFAPGMTVFPGGRVDAGDTGVPLRGELAATARRLDCPPEQAHALVAAAARETYEETGVLLTVPAATLLDERADVEAGRVPFGALLARHRLAVEVGALRPWSRWITPAGEVRRYDTRFFVARLPDGAEAHDVTTESSEAGWVPLGAALEQARTGERRMLPPTSVTLRALLPFACVDGVFGASARQSLEPVRPQLHRADDGTVTVVVP